MHSTTQVPEHMLCLTEGQTDGRPLRRYPNIYHRSLVKSVACVYIKRTKNMFIAVVLQQVLIINAGIFLNFKFLSQQLKQKSGK